MAPPPARCIQGQARYEGTIEDERRLFYVAMTRSQKFLHLTWAPDPGNQLFQRPSVRLGRRPGIKVGQEAPQPTTRPGTDSPQHRAASRTLSSHSPISSTSSSAHTSSSSAFLYGFNAPIHEALGYGKSLHDALAEVHARAIRGDVAEQPRLRRAGRGASAHSRTRTRRSAHNSRRQPRRSPSRLPGANGPLFDKIEFSAKQIEITVGRRHDRQWADRSDSPHRHRRDNDRRSQVDRPRPAGGRHRDTAPHLRPGVPESSPAEPTDYVEIYELDERGASRARSTTTSST